MKVAIISNFYPDSKDRFIGGIFVKERVNALAKYVDSIERIRVFSPELVGRRQIYTWRNAKKIIPPEFGYIHAKGKAIAHFPHIFHIPSRITDINKGKIWATTIYRVMQKHSFTPDILHAHFAWPSGEAAMLLSRLLGLPYVVTVHGYDVYDVPFRGSEYRKIVRNVLLDADAVITVAERTKQYIIDTLQIDREIYVIPNGFDAELFNIMPREEARQKLGLPKDAMILLNVGSLLPVKNQKDFIDIVGELRNRGQNVYGYIVGGGPLYKELEQYISNKGLRDVVKLVGFVPHTEIPLWMNAADALVITSEREGNPTVVVEALGCGTPVFAYDVGGIKEIVGRNMGCVVKYGENLKLVVCVNKESKLYQKRSNIRKQAVPFSWSRLSWKIAQIYENIKN